MRDWLALPLSPSSPSSPTSASKSGGETDHDDNGYDIINKATTTEEDEEEEEGASEGEISTWLSILAVFGVAKKLKSRSSGSFSSSSSGGSTNNNKSTNNKRQTTKAQQSSPLLVNSSEEEEEEEDISIIGETTDDATTTNDNGDDITTTEDEEEDITHTHTPDYKNDDEIAASDMKRSLSAASSIASSTDSDNSTPASSQIMPTSSKQQFNSGTKTITPVKICWNHGGKKVQVTGEFDNWSVSVDMNQDTENINCHVIYIPMDLTEKDIEFKFIVDGEWKYAIDLPHRTDSRGNVNNIVYKKSSLSIA